MLILNTYYCEMLTPLAGEGQSRVLRAGESSRVEIWGEHSEVALNTTNTCKYHLNVGKTEYFLIFKLLPFPNLPCVLHLFIF